MQPRTAQQDRGLQQKYSTRKAILQPEKQYKTQNPEESAIEGELFLKSEKWGS
jgi:hypothetical protein